MIHRKTCGCLIEVKYVNSIKGLTLQTKTIKKCDNCKNNELEKRKTKNEKKIKPK